MLEQPLNWLRKRWWGLIIAHLMLIVSTYLLIWQFAEPMGIPDNINSLPSFTKTRIFFHVVLTLLISTYLTLILDLIVRFKAEGLPQNLDAERYLVERIGFESGDTSINSCWTISERSIESEPTFKSRKDGFQGKILEVSATSKYAADYKVKPQASLGKWVDFIVRLNDTDAHLYLQVSVLTKDGSESNTLWLNLKIGEAKSQQIWENTDSSEWYYFVKPVYLDGNWLKLQIDLVKAVDDILGSKGWKLGVLKRCRLRGNLSLAYIGVYSHK